MTKLFSFFAVTVATLAIVAILALSSSVIEAHSSSKRLSPIERAIAWKNRETLNSRLRYVLQHDPEIRDLPVLKGESWACLGCKASVGSLVDLLESAEGVNITLSLVKKEVCDKKFANNTKEAALCYDVAKILIKVVSEAFTKASDGGWDVTTDLCNIMHKCKADCCSTPYVPEQLTISFAENVVLNPNGMSMRVSWMTQNITTGDFISYKEASSTTATWQNISSKMISQKNSIPDESWSFYGYFHSGIMTGLKPNTTYDYYVGSSNGQQQPLQQQPLQQQPLQQYQSKKFAFTTLPLNAGTAARPLRVAAFADMGTRNSQDTIAGIVAKAQAGEIDFVLGTGDLGYSDMDLGRFATFAKMIEPFAAIVPFMTVPGNHEANFLLNFSQYRHRWIMPSAGPGAPSDAMYYYFQIGPVFFAQFNTETFIDTANIDQAQVNWMKPLLAKANSVPGSFVIINQHRPLYCSVKSSEACFGGKESQWLRMEVEHIYYMNHVDFVFSGHVHNLETMMPIKEGQIAGNFNSSSSLIQFPTAPMYMVGGNAGQKESLQSFNGDAPYPWDRKRVVTIGYQLFEFVQKPYPEDGNKLHTSLKVTALQSNNSQVLDEFTLISSR